MHELSRYVTHADRGDFAPRIEAGSGEAKSPVDIKKGENSSWSAGSDWAPFWSCAKKRAREFTYVIPIRFQPSDSTYVDRLRFQVRLAGSIAAAVPRPELNPPWRSR